MPAEDNQIVHVIEINSDKDIIRARKIVRALTIELGFGKLDQAKITTVVSELARNIFLFAHCGVINAMSVERACKIGISLSAVDNGPGIGEIQRALRPYTSSSNGLGVGLPGVRNIMDEFSIKSSECGTEISTVKWLEKYG
ncbi:serine/threonine-protein kinase RsbT [Virgibacillus siamensis]|uniref:Serine/threonine-protein kinase RsbT n=1 Tax=Virgibacillus siamensis TaxID=480071 RepID=A0ABP3RK62_9BACI